MLMYFGDIDVCTGHALINSVMLAEKRKTVENYIYSWMMAKI